MPTWGRRKSGGMPGRARNPSFPSRVPCTPCCDHCCGRVHLLPGACTLASPDGTQLSISLGIHGSEATHGIHVPLLLCSNLYSFYMPYGYTGHSLEWGEGTSGEPAGQWSWLLWLQGGGGAGDLEVGALPHYHICPIGHGAGRTMLRGKASCLRLPSTQVCSPISDNASDNIKAPRSCDGQACN